MRVTVYRHEEYSKFIVTVENNYETIQYTLYDVSVTELAEFIKSVTAA